MITDQQYVVLSLELHMFFGRIMKEHSLFLEAGFTPANADFAQVADQYKQSFETILQSAIILGDGIINPQVVSSGELVTDYTLSTEEKTQFFTGIAINQEITKVESKLYGATDPQVTAALVQQVSNLNAEAMPIIAGLVDFKQGVLNDVLSCRIFTANFPLMIEHILHEAQIYQGHLAALENRQNPAISMKDTELYWDQLMLEHALFIRSLLDPTEFELINQSNGFAREYLELLRATRTATDAMLDSITDKALQETIKFRDFKAAATKGIDECKIRSIILPLLADHVLREANHYIRLLQQMS